MFTTLGPGRRNRLGVTVKKVATRLDKILYNFYFQRGTEKYKDGKDDKKYAMAWKKEYPPMEDEVCRVASLKIMLKT